MPDLDAPREASERSVPRDRAPISDEMGYHPFIESEFPQGKGRCATCGGGPDAAIHQRPVDQMERIADALECIADTLMDWAYPDLKRPEKAKSR